MPPSDLAASFDAAAEEYERGRPGWPREILDLEPLAGAASVVDLGAGTGKLARLLVQRFERVVAVEPLDRMREVLSRVVPQAEALAGTAEQIPVSSGEADAVFCADAFHWFDGDAALAEIARVLAPRGALVLMWNVQTGPTEPSIAPAAEIVNTRGHRERSFKRYESGEWREPFARAPFEPLREAQFEHVQVLDRDGMLAHLLSMSWIAVLPAEEKTQLVADIRPLIDAEEYRRPIPD